MMLSRTGWGETSLPVAFQTVGGRRAPWGCAAGAPYRGTASPPPPPVCVCVCVCVCVRVRVGGGGGAVCGGVRCTAGAGAGGPQWAGLAKARACCKGRVEGAADWLVSVVGGC